ncbi:hypothetical protein ABEB36_012658 [Hypothenemus hampei]|uniref:Uncharacterized protein n=1 Tax=Hypothenemus hampei TaxID=57062 RepID=A0ABD1EC11_HYPHA
MLVFFGMPLLLVYNTGPTFWESDTPFMYELYLPFDRRNYYWFLIIVDSLMVWVTGIAYIACQTTFYGLFMYGALRFQILQLKIDKLCTYGGEDSLERLRSVIIEHHDIINFIDTLNEKISHAVMSTFMVNSIKLGSAVVANMDQNIEDLPFPMIFLTLLFAEVYFLGWTCNKIQDQSLRVAERIYAIQWYDKGKDFKVMVEMMMIDRGRLISKLDHLES